MNHHTIIALVLVIAGVVALFAFLVFLFKPQKAVNLYVLKSSLVSPAERSFLGCLESVLPSDLRVFAKVRLADIFSVEKTLDKSAWWSALNKITSKHVDFVLCRASDLNFVAAIELDDKSHDRDDRRERDAFLEKICAHANVPLIRFKAQKTYNPEEIARRINEAWDRPTGPRQ